MQDEDEVLKELRLAEMELEDVDAGWISESGQIEALRNALRHMLRAIRLRFAMKVKP
jgi:hypothetical protein